MSATMKLAAALAAVRAVWAAPNFADEASAVRDFMEAARGPAAGAPRPRTQLALSLRGRETPSLDQFLDLDADLMSKADRIEDELRGLDAKPKKAVLASKSVKTVLGDQHQRAARFFAEHGLSKVGRLLGETMPASALLTKIVSLKTSNSSIDDVAKVNLSKAHVSVPFNVFTNSNVTAKANVSAKANVFAQANVTAKANVQVHKAQAVQKAQQVKDFTALKNILKGGSKVAGEAQPLKSLFSNASKVQSKVQTPKPKEPAPAAAKSLVASLDSAADSVQMVKEAQEAEARRINIYNRARPVYVGN